jgi:hypothetical protein
MNGVWVPVMALYQSISSVNATPVTRERVMVTSIPSFIALKIGRAGIYAAALAGRVGNPCTTRSALRTAAAVHCLPRCVTIP